eukprot:TRINITY_DN4839_c0_g1_i3.p1 TRINITY_DN4839_c0_g1~~TRINITY_DN4839_c0_g1_i3.p1  ORF type:complete len:635 (+),score=113.81 TRINITY_DN4839_c0_g1_i3:56-1960(+)
MSINTRGKKDADGYATGAFSPVQAQRSDRPVSQLSTKQTSGQKTGLPQMRKFDLHTFSGDIDVNAFVEDITKSLVVPVGAKASTVATDPKNLVRPMELYISELSGLEEETRNTIRQLSGKIETLEHQHKQGLESIASQGELVMEKFQELDSKITTVGQTAVRIGDSLDIVDKQKNRGIEAKELTEDFIRLNTEKPSSLAEFDQDSQNLQENASLFRKLYGYTRDLKIPSIMQAVKSVETIYFEIERKLLDEFTAGCTSKSIPLMKQCASTLFEFDGGETCIRAYLTSRDIFLNTRYLMEDANVLSEQYNLKRVYDDLVSVCQEECIIIREVFPNPERVVRALIEKIFQQRVQAILERALEKRDTIEPSLFLEKMEVIHDLTISLGNRMEQFEVRDVSINMLVNDILTLFRESYIEVEKKYVESLFQSKLKAIMISTGQPEQKKKQGFGNILGKAKDEHSYLDTISLELCESYLTAAQKSLQRCRKLSSGEQIAENMAHLVDIMLKALFTNYLISATRRAVDHIPIADRRGPPIIQFFEAVMLVNAATQKYLLLVAEEVVPVLKDAFQFYTSTKVEQETALMALEDLLRDGLQKASATIVTHISHIMEDDQKKNDFRPREDESFEDTTLVRFDRY